jgi:hypothetical protein
LKKIENGINDDRRKLKKIDNELSNLNNKLNYRTQEVYDRVNSSNIKYDNSLRLVQDNLNNFYVKLFNSTRLFEVRMNNMNDSLNAETFNIYNQMLKLGDEIAREKNQTSRLRVDLNYAINEVDKITNKSLAKIENELRLFYKQVSADTSGLNTRVNDMHRSKLIDQKPLNESLKNLSANFFSLIDNFKSEQSNLKLAELKIEKLSNKLNYLANKGKKVFLLMLYFYFQGKPIFI